MIVSLCQLLQSKKVGFKKQKPEKHATALVCTYSALTVKGVCQLVQSMRLDVNQDHSIVLSISQMALLSKQYRIIKGKHLLINIYSTVKQCKGTIQRIADLKLKYYLYHGVPHLLESLFCLMNLSFVSSSSFLLHLATLAVESLSVLL